MTEIKAYTDIEQSKKLAKILPLESADMWYQHIGTSIKDGSEKPIYFPIVIRYCESDEDIPCWSLAALIGVLPSATLDSSDDHHFRVQCMKKSTEWYDNPVDAYYEMILKLHEQHLI